MTKTPVDIGSLADPKFAPLIKVGDMVVPVLGMSGVSAHRFALAQKSNDAAEMMEVMLAAVEEAVPDLPAEARQRLTFEQITAIVQLAQGKIEDVEREIAERAAGN
jgi:hypothetical protein